MLDDLLEKLKRESQVGGELTHLPCPLCGRPRSQRSDYIRCTPCGMNWLDGEDLSRDARLSRVPPLDIRPSKTEQDITA